MLVTSLSIRLVPGRPLPRTAYHCPLYHRQTEALKTLQLKDDAATMHWWRCGACGTWHLSFNRQDPPV